MGYQRANVHQWAQILRMRPAENPKITSMKPQRESLLQQGRNYCPHCIEDAVKQVAEECAVTYVYVR